VIRTFYNDPQLAPLFPDPRFQRLVEAFAHLRVQLLEERGVTDQPSLHALASAHARLGQLDRALEVAERGVRKGGPLQGQLLSLAEQLRRRRAERARRQGTGDASSADWVRGLDADDALRRLDQLISRVKPLPPPAAPPH
jgi:hypothetical protein